ncbi:AsmA family protein [Acetobacter sp.]|uniref:AsmA family protein n=1 Tax=Acetobacter sp. TaxID=440 RepID=UPI0039EB5D20
MKFKTKIGLGVGGLAVLLGGTGLASALMDANWMRTRLIEAVQHQTGRTLRIDSLHVWLLPYPWISAQGVGLSNIAGGVSPEMFSAGEIRARLAVSPLFHHRVVLDDVSISGPKLTLERSPDGTANWLFQPPSSVGGGSGETTGNGQHWNLALDSLHLRDGAVAWDDSRNHVSGAADLDRADLTGLDGTMAKVNIRGHHGTGYFQLTGTTGPLPPVSGQPWPLNLTTTFSIDKHQKGQMQVAGVVADPTRDAGYDLQINGSLGELRDLEALFPHADLPQTADISLQAGVTGSGRSPSLRMLHLRTGQTNLNQFLAGLRANTLTLNADNADTPVAVNLDGQINSQPATLKGTLGTLEQTISAIRNPDAIPLPVTLAVGDGSSAITLSGVLGGLKTALTIQGALPAVAFGSDKPNFVGLKVDGQLASSAPLAALKQADPAFLLRNSTANLDVSAQRMTWQSVAWDNVAAHIAADKGVLVIDPIRGNGVGSTQGIAQSGRIVYDASSAVPHLTVTAAPFVLPSQTIETWTGLPPFVNGSIQIVGTVTADGIDHDTWEKTAVGHVGLSMVGGRVSTKLVENVIGHDIPGKGDLALRCFGTHLQLANGSATIGRLGLEADFLSLTGHGAMDLTNGGLDLHLSPRIGVGNAAVASPVAVGGTISHPQPRLEPGADGRFAISIGGAASVGDQCSDLLAAAREGLPGPAAAPPPAGKAGGLMNMLKGLLR